MAQAAAQTIFARDVAVEQSAIWTVAAGTVTFRRGGLVGVLLARDVRGEVKVLLDWKGALAAGAVIGLLMGILRRR